ncbi:MAG TPA: hypothetical protein VFH63_05745 [candidate division Zixibacteria bacterium]|nr:hypothetical protein [candidate division Zixibacteria bacterium]
MSVSRRRGTTLLVGLAMTLGLALPASVAAAKPLPNYQPVPAPAWVNNPTLDPSRISSSLPEDARQAASGSGGSADYEVGDQVFSLVLNEVTGQFGITSFTVRAIGQHIEVWVQNNLNFPAGDPRNDVVVTDEQIAYLVNEFDTNIYPKTSEFWRTPQTRTGQNAVLDDILRASFSLPVPDDAYVSNDGQDRVIAMVSNVRDENYFDPTFPVYIAGFFSSQINGLLDRNVITIDAYDWGNRVGPNDSPWRPNDGPQNDRPNLYEGTFAHEYQHLLHADQNPGEESWVNEGLSDWTEFLVGYGLPDGHWDTAQEFAENSLVIWGDQGQSTEILADYGQAFMFFHYLYGLYGPSVLNAIFENQGFGMAGVDAALDSLGIGQDFADLYHDYAVARLVLANTGSYRIPDIPSPVVLNDEAFNTPGAPPWGSDYLAIENPKKVSSISFNGVDLISRDTAWTSVDDPLETNGQVLWSGVGDEQDRWAIFETDGGSTLTFDTLYDLEEHWDFGFVMASTDNGATWQALTNANTRDDIDPAGYPAIKDVLNAGGEGFTGETAGWTTESFSLPAGTDLVGFRFMSDWATQENTPGGPANFYVDNVAVDGTTVSDGSNASDFKDITFYAPIEVNFTVDLVSLPRAGSFGNSSFKVLHLITDDATEQASADQIRQALRNSSQLVLVVTYDAPQGISDYAPYEVDISYR